MHIVCVEPEAVDEQADYSLALALQREEELTVVQAQQLHSSGSDAPTATYAALSGPPSPSDVGRKCLCKGCTTRTEGHAVCPMCRQPVQGVCEVFE
jgi:hypothetical protein